MTLSLDPGQTETIPFVLAWDFPMVAFADNTTVWMRHYTNFYGAETTPTNEYVEGSSPHHRGAAIARDALLDRDDALDAV